MSVRRALLILTLGVTVACASHRGPHASTPTPAAPDDGAPGHIWIHQDADGDVAICAELPERGGWDCLTVDELRQTLRVRRKL